MNANLLKQSIIVIKEICFVFMNLHSPSKGRACTPVHVPASGRPHADMDLYVANFQSL